MKKLFVFLVLTCLSFATQLVAQTITIYPRSNSGDIMSLKNYHNDNGTITLNTGIITCENTIVATDVKTDGYYLLNQQEYPPNVSIYGKRGPNNSVTIESTPKNNFLRDTFEHPSEPKTRLKIEPTPKVVKPNIIPLESR